ncbi:MAG: flagellar basal body-associated protein FliL [Bradyrhizobium sp.]
MADNEQAEGVAAEAVAPPTKGKFKLIVTAVGVLGILGAGAAGYFFLFHQLAGQVKAEAPPPKPPVFVEVPNMLVNLSGTPTDHVQYLKVKVVLEVKNEKQAEAIKPSMPRITDIFQTYLRELRPSDLNGSAGLFRLREALTRRVNEVVAPTKVAAVLFKQIIVQ